MMGWASAGAIFDPVAQALIDLGLSDDVRREVATVLIKTLQEGDWDTEDESLGEFRHDPAIVAAFVANGVGNRLSEWGSEVDGLLDHDPRARRWTLTCRGKGGCGQVGVSEEDTAAGHDRMVRLWVRHDAEKHDGDGTVPGWMLIEKDGE